MYHFHNSNDAPLLSSDLPALPLSTRLLEFSSVTTIGMHPGGEVVSRGIMIPCSITITPLHTPSTCAVVVIHGSISPSCVLTILPPPSELLGTIPLSLPFHCVLFSQLTLTSIMPSWKNRMTHSCNSDAKKTCSSNTKKPPALKSVSSTQSSKEDSLTGDADSSSEDEGNFGDDGMYEDDDEEEGDDEVVVAEMVGDEERERVCRAGWSRLSIYCPSR